MQNQLKMTILASLFIALISVGAFMAIPIGPVPIVLQNMFVLLAALVLPPAWALGCMAIYLLMGLAGLPIFAGGTSGLAKLAGPTGGYLVGYLPAIFLTAVISKKLGRKLSGDIPAMIIGSLIVYALGVSWLKVVLSMSWAKAVGAGMVPFLLGDAFKITAAGFIAQKLRPMLKA